MMLIDTLIMQQAADDLWSKCITCSFFPFLNSLFFTKKKTLYLVAGQAKFMSIQVGDRSYLSATCVSAIHYNYNLNICVYFTV